MLGDVAGVEAVERDNLLGARDVGQRAGADMGDESEARAVLGAVAAVLLLIVAVPLLRAVSVIRMPVRSRAVITGRADAARHGRDAAQRNEREHRADEQQLEGACHRDRC